MRKICRKDRQFSEQIVEAYPWVPVTGYGAHIKSTQNRLIIQKKNKTDEIPLDEVKNLLIVGGHSISSATIMKLVKKGTFISFFEADGTPVGIIRPFQSQNSMDLYEIQKNIPRQRYAISLAKGSLKSRLSAIGQLEEKKNIRLFYEGELELLCKSESELTFLIKLDEIRRLHRLTSDMYYEIMSRSIPSELGYKRRSPRPFTDPVNVMLSFGYAMLFGNCNISVVGFRLNPDNGLLYDGSGSLVQDLMDPLKAEMIDANVFALARECFPQSDYDVTSGRCILSDDFIRRMITVFQGSINNKKIHEQVSNFLNSVTTGEEFKVLY